MARLVAFSMKEGKTLQLPWLLPLVDRTPHKTYVESFGGSGAVLLNKIPSPVEIFNDLQGEIVNFFRVLRERGPELIGRLELTPYSREDFAESCEGLEDLDEVEQARQFFVRARQVRAGMLNEATAGRWATTKKDSRRGMALTVSRWLSGIEGLEEIALRLKRVQLENMEGAEVIRRYDTPQTLHFVDPPAILTRTIKTISPEFTQKQHQDLIQTLFELKGKVILCGAPGYELPDWHLTTIDGSNDEAKLKLWTNFRTEWDG